MRQRLCIKKNSPTLIAGPSNVASNITINGFAVMTHYPATHKRRSMAHPPLRRARK